MSRRHICLGYAKKNAIFSLTLQNLYIFLTALLCSNTTAQLAE